MKKFKFVSFLFLMIMSLGILCSCCDNNESQGSQNGNEEHSHEWIEATCTTPKICSKCNETEGEALGHIEVVDAAKAATCTATGLTEGSHCSVCEEVFVAQEEVAALGHT